ncbi:TIGR02452 family protein [Paenibacillus sp. ACRSA]|uniref:TIGR02452 family protein n=1 Tax=Paenibacillus sp. ACRSA TaxID=2918211 RepID=UPI001EF45387|nr:TIGR02452 family protein [Paenibacillus sp. ACRSA]MCG7377699.1 TIGR02452 family protein [Paenibacillus sp. ACRSA]
MSEHKQNQSTSSQTTRSQHSHNRTAHNQPTNRTANNKTTNQRASRSRIAHETLAILEQGSYVNSYDRNVWIDEEKQYAIQHSVLYRPAELQSLKDPLKQSALSAKPSSTIIEVTGETTLAAAARLVTDEQLKDVVCLNFASAKNPGGGFLGGSQAQEESLARATGLYPCIAQMTEMYEHNRKLRTCLYSDHMIYSPAVPVIRDDQDRLLDKPYCTAFITAPAVNAGVVRAREEADDQVIESVMKQRIRYILDVAVARGHRTIVLGAFGCGVFRNDPVQVAKFFHDVLVQEHYREAFERVVFAVFDRTKGQSTLDAFQQRFVGA